MSKRVNTVLDKIKKYSWGLVAVSFINVLQAKPTDFYTLVAIDGGFKHKLNYKMTRTIGTDEGKPIGYNRDDNAPIFYNLGINAHTNLHKHLFLEVVAGIKFPIKNQIRDFNDSSNPALKAWDNNTNSNIEHLLSPFLRVKVGRQINNNFMGYLVGGIQGSRYKLIHELSYGASLFEGSKESTNAGLGLSLGIGGIYKLQPKLSLFIDIVYNRNQVQFDDFNYDTQSTIKFTNPTYKQNYISINCGLIYKFATKELN